MPDNSQPPTKLKTRERKPAKNDSESGKHVDIVFPWPQFRQIESAASRLNILTFGETVRRGFRFFMYFLEHTDENSIVIITDGEPIRNGEPALPYDNEKMRVAATIIL